MDRLESSDIRIVKEHRSGQIVLSVHLRVNLSERWILSIMREIAYLGICNYIQRSSSDQLDIIFKDETFCEMHVPQVYNAAMKVMIEYELSKTEH